MMKSKNTLTVSLIGGSWILLGLGYQAIVIRYVPAGAALMAEALGLFLAGALTGELYLRAVESIGSPIGRGLVTAGYLMFAPLGMMAGLGAPGSLEPVGSGSWVPFLIGAPVLIMLAATVAVVLGLGFTGGLALAARRVSVGHEAGQ
jgi:hypothetical protein